MRRSLNRAAAVVAATAATLCIATAAPAAASPTGPIYLNAYEAENDGLLLIYRSTVIDPFVRVKCTAEIQGVAASGQTITVPTWVTPYGFATPPGYNQAYIRPASEGVYAITYTCDPSSTLADTRPSSSNGSPIFIRVGDGLQGSVGPTGGRTLFGS